MLVAQLTSGGFDILNMDETNTSIVRQSDMVRLSWKDEENRLIQLVKTAQASASIGTLLVARGNALVPTGDSHSSRTVAKLLAPISASSETKQITIQGVVYTAHLLPVQVIA